MAFLDTTPRKADSDNNLLFKIAQELSNRNGGAYPPRLGDSDNNLLFKIAQLIILGGGTAGTCAADLAACQAAATVSAATIAALQAQLAACQAIVPPQDFLITWTPGTVDLGNQADVGLLLDSGGHPALNSLTNLSVRQQLLALGVTVTGLTGLTSLSFPNLTSTTSGFTYAVQNNAALASLTFPALATLPVLLTISGNSSLTALIFPVLTSSSGITLTSNAALQTLSFPALISTTGSFSLSTGNTAIASISAPLLSSITGGLTITSRLNLTSLVLTSLVSLTGALTVSSCTALPSVSLPALVTAATGISFSGDTLLTSVSFPNYLPTNTRAQNFSACALNQASVDHVLARCVANAAYVSGTVTLSGGTNSTPSAAGLVDKAILVGRGVTVLNN